GPAGGNGIPEQRRGVWLLKTPDDDRGLCIYDVDRSTKVSVKGGTDQDGTRERRHRTPELSECQKRRIVRNRVVNRTHEIAAREIEHVDRAVPGSEGRRIPDEQPVVKDGDGRSETGWIAVTRARERIQQCPRCGVKDVYGATALLEDRAHDGLRAADRNRVPK